MMLWARRTSSFHPGKTEQLSANDTFFPPWFLLHTLKLSFSCLMLSYPYSEDYTKPTQYMNTRCPAWCDRILMSHTVHEFIHRVSQNNCMSYCMFSHISTITTVVERMLWVKRITLVARILSRCISLFRLCTGFLPEEESSGQLAKCTGIKTELTPYLYINRRQSTAHIFLCLAIVNPSYLCKRLFPSLHRDYSML